MDHSTLLSPLIHECVPAGHAVDCSCCDTVVEERDPSAAWITLAGERGHPPHHPAMMTALPLHDCCQGVYASRRIAGACEQRLAFVGVIGMGRRR